MGINCIVRNCPWYIDGKCGDEKILTCNINSRAKDRQDEQDEQELDERRLNALLPNGK